METFYDKSREQVCDVLHSSASGLSSEAAKEKVLTLGYNILIEKKKASPLRLFFSQFSSPLIWILLAAVLISALLEEYVDALVIGVILLINAILGFVQEYNAERAIAALSKLTSLKAKVFRDNKLVLLDASDIVPGDVILLDTGDKIPADAFILEAVSLETQEASLTGESTPLEKKQGILSKNTILANRTNMLFAGTIVTRGRGKAIVTATGMHTEIGKIAGLLQEQQNEETPLQKKLASLGKSLSILVIFFAALLFGIGVYRGIPLPEMFLNAVSLAVAVVPEGLPAVVTITLALGVKRMIKRKALVRRLPAVETLGECTVICTDKTGTLTENQMTVRTLFVNNQDVSVTGIGYNPQGTFSLSPKKFYRLLEIGALCNNAKITKEGIIGDPTEAALLIAAQKAGFKDENLQKYLRLKEIPFDSQEKTMTTFHKTNEGVVAYLKGAPEKVLAHCSSILINDEIKKLTQKDKKMILAKNESFAKEALRVLGFAYKEVRSEHDTQSTEEMVFVGLQGMIDPPRLEAKLAIEKCKTAGIRVVMITGDHISTAVAIARELGIEGKALSGEQIDGMQLDDVIDEVSIYARVNPEHKINIVNALKKKGHIVAMTGDGVNDAPALKRADIGVAMAITGTDVAKESSDIILTDDNFVSIVNAVEEGRGVYDNIKKFFAFFIAGNIAELLIIAYALLIDLPMPLTAAMILLINLVTDGLPALAIGADSFDADIMQRKPRNPKEKLYEHMEHYLYVYPIIIAAGTISLFSYILNTTGDLERAQTIAFATLIMGELFAAYSCRSLYNHIFTKEFFKNKYLLLTTGLSFLILLSIVYLPSLSHLFHTTALALEEFLLSAAVAFATLLLVEIAKGVRRWVNP